MPTKIVSERSNPQRGLISQHDLIRVIQDFENFVEIGSASARSFKKISVVSIPALLIKHLLEEAEKDDMYLENYRINLRFGITLPDQKDCLDNRTDVSNHLTTVLIVETKGVEKDQPGNFVIAPGFKEFFENPNTDGACCPVIHPGGGTGVV